MVIEHYWREKEWIYKPWALANGLLEVWEFKLVILEKEREQHCKGRIYTLYGERENKHNTHYTPRKMWTDHLYMSCGWRWQVIRMVATPSSCTTLFDTTHAPLLITMSHDDSKKEQWQIYPLLIPIDHLHTMNPVLGLINHMRTQCLCCCWCNIHIWKRDMGDLVLRDQEKFPVQHWMLPFEEVFTM